jgi:nitrogen regulatory protein PII
MKEAMKKLEIIVKGNQLQAIQELLDRTEVSGYTVIPNISGKGHHGLHQGHLMFNELDALDLVITVVPEDKVETILAGIAPLFEHHSGVVFVSDVTVVRPEYFKSKDA